MSLHDLRDLYQDMILDHGRDPRNFGRPDQASHTQVGHNPLCGDKLAVYVQAVNQRVEAAHFVGEGCAIAMASASLMTEAIKGKTLAEIENLFQGFHQLVTQGNEPATSLGKLAIFAGVAAFPMRVKCATLPWHTLQAALAGEGSDSNNHPVTTESS